MTVGVADLHALAVDLAAGADEARWRSSVSRAYYASYHACEAWHGQLPMPGTKSPPGTGVHHSFCHQLKHPAPGTAAALAKKSKIMGMMLDVMRGRRKVADYDLGDTLDQAEALSVCANAGHLMAKAAEFP